MRKIQIQVPPPVTIRNFELTYALFVRHLCDTDDRFTRTAAGIRAAVRIEAAIDSFSSSPRPLHLVEEGDWALLTQAAETPTGGYPEAVESRPDGTLVRTHKLARACLAFVDAISSGAPLVANGQPSASPSLPSSPLSPPSPPLPESGG